MNNNNFNIENYFLKPNSSIEWLALIKPGEPVLDDHNWVCSKKDNYPLFDGYQAARIVKNKDGKYLKIVCTITKSSLGLPLFSCKSFDYNISTKKFDCNPSAQLSLRKISSVSNAFLKKLDVHSNKVWSGSQFFGLNRKDVRFILDKLLKESNSSPSLLVPLPNNSLEVSQPILTQSDDDIKHNYTWLGLVNLGSKVLGNFMRFFYYQVDSETTIYLPDGYSAKICVKDESNETHIVLCCIKAVNSTPIFSCLLNDNTKFESTMSSVTVKQLFNHLKCYNRNWSGYRFFGLHRKDIIAKLNIKNEIKDFENNQILNDIAKIQSRQGGPTHSLKSKQAKDSRNQKIEKLVDSASFGDVTGFVEYLIEKYPNVIDESIENNPSYKEHLVKLIGKKPKIVISAEKSASILMTKFGLSQREYISVRSSLAKQNVLLAPYEQISHYLKSLNLGEIQYKSCNCSINCMSAICSFRETLALIINNKYLPRVNSNNLTNNFSIFPRFC